MLRLRAVLLLLTLLVLLGSLTSVVAQEDDICSEPGAPTVCDSLFGSTFRINRIESRASVFANPQLRIFVEAPNSPDEIIRVYLPDYTDKILEINKGLSAGANREFCNLLIVAFEDTDNKAAVDYWDLPSGDNLNAYTFCRDFNLPGIEEAHPPFPEGEIFNADTQSLAGYQESTLTDQMQAQLAGIFQRARSEECLGDPDADELALNLNSLATQFAVFIAVDSNNIAGAWDNFHNLAHNSVFLKNYHGIYCLLGETPPELAVDLSADVTRGNAPLAVAFDYESSGDVIAYELQINANLPGGVSTPEVITVAPSTPLPTRVFTQPGNYSARLSAQGVPFTVEAGTVVPQEPALSEPVRISVALAPLIIPSPTPTLLEQQPFTGVFRPITFGQMLWLVGGGLLVIVGAAVLMNALISVGRWRLLLILVIIGIILVSALFIFARSSAAPFTSVPIETGLEQIE